MDSFLIRWQPAGSINPTLRLWLVLAVVISAADFGLSRLSAQTDAAAQAVKAKPITEPVARAFADALTKAVQNEDIEGANSLIDWSGMFEKATGLPQSSKLEKTRADFKRGGMAVLKRSGGLVATISALIKQGGTYKCLRINVTDKAANVMFRLKLPNSGGLNYHQFFLRHNDNQTLIASDIYIFMNAELMSDSFRRGWLPVAKQQLKTISERLTTADEPLVANIEAIQKMQESVKNSKFDEALKQYHELPDVIRRDKNVLLVRMRAAQGVSVEKYGEAIDDLQKIHPNDPALDFLLIDGYSIRKQYDMALKCLDRTNKNVGGDPMLLLMRASLLQGMKKFPEARKSIADAIKADPDMFEAYTTGISVSLAEQNFDETVRCLTVLKKQFGLEVQGMGENPDYGPFLKSPQYRQWMQTRK